MLRDSGPKVNDARRYRRFMGSGALEELVSMVPPQRMGIEPSDPIWDTVQRLVGGRIPTDLKDVVHLYGDQVLRDQVRVLSGRVHTPHGDRDLVSYLRMLQEMRDDPVFDDEPWLHGVAGHHWLPWATDGADDYVLSAWKDDADSGWVGVAGIRGEDWQPFPHGVAEWLVAILRGDIHVELATLPEP